MYFATRLPKTCVNFSYCRAVFKKGDKCLVHFYGLPESHDNWGVMYPPEDKEVADMGLDRDREDIYR